MRGEYFSGADTTPADQELPPRARRIPALFPFLGPAAGTTSACAENTTSMRHALTLMWNYLRVRGEYRDSVPEDRLSMELPPRARRILMATVNTQGVIGTTSACAENTSEKMV